MIQVKFLNAEGVQQGEGVLLTEKEAEEAFEQLPEGWTMEEVLSMAKINCGKCGKRHESGQVCEGVTGTGGKKSRVSPDNTEEGLPDPRIKGGLTKGTRIVVAPGISKRAADAWIKKAHVPQKGHYEYNEENGDLEYVVDKD